MTWLDEIIDVLKELGGMASYKNIYNLVLKRGSKQSSIENSDWKATIRQTIYDHSSNSQSFRTGKDIFYSVKGLGKGVWGLRELCLSTPVASDISDPELPQRIQQKVYRVLRDTTLARSIKALHKNVCQICENFIEIPNGQRYSETHHIQPFGTPHNGPDVAENIIVLCPNHHVEFDYGLIAVKPEDFQMICASLYKFYDSKLKIHSNHNVGKRYLKYHLEKIFKWKRGGGHSEHN